MLKKYEMNKIYNEDCLEAMKQIPDKFFDLAIVDPPYRNEEDNQPTKDMREKAVDKNMKTFGGKPTQEYFDELFRVSKNQIIWGGNNFIENLKNTNCFLFWYKKNPMDNYSDGELAWTSFSSVARCINIPYFGTLNADKDGKIHPTQKPVKLYEWLLNNYAKKGDRILDTHLGSASSIIACKKLGYDYLGFEISEDYFKLAKQRIKDFEAQGNMFELFD